MAGKWRIEGGRGIWLVRGDARAAVSSMRGEALGREAAAARVDAWFPEGWGGEGAGTLAAIGRALEGGVAGGGALDAGWLKKTLQRALRDGRVTAVRAAFGAPAGDTAPESAPPPVVAPVLETAWVEFVVIEEGTNKPLSGVQLMIKLPDGSRRDLATDDEGAVVLDPVHPGVCEVGCTVDAPRSGTTLGFVALGHGASSVAQDEPSARAISAGFRIMNVIHHKVRSGETLAGLATANGMTWQELARFNFGTEDPNKVNDFLRGRVGCTRKTKDRKNYVFSDSDEPGILWLPRRWEQKGMSTSQVHVIRVRRLTRTFKLFMFSH